MKDYSEDYHCAGWLSGLEFLLWEVPAEDERTWMKARREIALECWVLAEIAGGWWVYEEKTCPDGHGPVFVSMERWQQILSQSTIPSQNPTSANDE